MHVRQSRLCLVQGVRRQMYTKAPAPAAAAAAAAPAAPPMPSSSVGTATPGTATPGTSASTYQPYLPQKQQHSAPPAFGAPSAPTPIQQPPAATAAPKLQTFRVLIPPGTQPGQQIRVRVDTGNANSIMVAVPDRRRWQQDPNVGSRPFFDIKVQQQVSGGGGSANANDVASSASAPPAYTSQPPATAAAPEPQTYRVLIPPGTQPGQHMRVPTGDGNSIMAAVPDRREWQQDPKVGTQPFFVIKVQRQGRGGANAAASSAPPAYGSSSGVPSSPIKLAGPAAAAAAAGLVSSLMAGGSTGRPTHNSHMSQSMPPSYHSQSATASANNSHFAPISPQHVASHPTTLILKESMYSYTGDDSKIKDASGNTLFNIRAEMMTMSQRRYIHDSTGRRVGQLRRSRLLPSVHIGTPSDEKRCSVVMSGFMNPMNCNANIMLDERQKIGKISGNWRAKKFKITIDGTVVATVARKKTMQSMFMGADSYCIDVEAGVDLVFVSLLAVALDELYHDKKGGMQGSGGGGLASSILGPGF